MLVASPEASTKRTWDTWVLAVLVTLLPGIREVRTPLVAGYLWLVVIWLAIEPYLPTRKELPEPLSGVLDCDQAMRDVGLGAALTFGALLLGMLAEGVYDIVRRVTQTRTVSRESSPRSATLRKWHSAMARTFGRLKTGPTVTGMMSLKLVATERVREAERQLEGRRLDVRDLAISVGAVGDSGETPTGEAYANLKRELDALSTRAVRELLAAWLTIRILDDLDLLARRLIGDHRELFADYDRLKSEGQFRFAVVPPLLALTVILSLIWTPWIAIGAIGTPILLRQAIRKSDAASDLLIDSVLIRRIDAPAFEQLSRTAAEISQP